MNSTLFAPDVRDEGPQILKLRGPTENDPAALTLRDCFHLFQEAELDGRSRETVSEYRTHLNRWEQCWREAEAGEKYRTISPVLVEIGRAELVAFQRWLKEYRTERGSEPLSDRTIDKHLGSVQTILRWAVKYELLTSAPALDRLAGTCRGRKITLTVDEADRLKVAARVAEWPKGLLHPAALYWETLIVGWISCGFRTQEQVRYESRMNRLCWENVHRDRWNPHPDGKWSNDAGWLFYTPEKQKGAKPEPVVVPMTAAYRRHLDALWPGDGAKGSVFPFPLSNDSFYATWDAIVRAAEITIRPGLDGSQPKLLIMHLRKTCTTWYNDHRPGIAQYITGHADDRTPDGSGTLSQVSRDHYDWPEKRVQEAVSTLPLPASFERPLYGRERQLTLF